jgi:large subunit ribosomal protein L33
MAKEKVEHIVLVCTETGDMNYYTSRAKTSPKLELKKYNPKLRKHTLHKEKKRK